jgi:hypothetical protein
MSTPKAKSVALMIGVILLALAPLIALIGIWWWAIFGLPEPVGIALVVTATTFALAGIVGITLGGEAL